MALEATAHGRRDQAGRMCLPDSTACPIPVSGIWGMPVQIVSVRADWDGVKSRARDYHAAVMAAIADIPHFARPGKPLRAAGDAMRARRGPC